MDETTPGFYHCISRCVRHAFLCGEDALTGRSFAHRKQWAEDRLLELAEVFAVGVYAYAVMSNHLHDMVYLALSATLAWSPDEVAQRWVRFTLARADGGIDEAACEARATALAGNPERIAVMREWLGSLSWCMRILNEPIVRRANGEDECTGHFWEARFKCQALLDDAAVLACMAYVDLNPIRTGLERGLPGSPHTSAQRPCKRCPAMLVGGRARPSRSAASHSMLAWPQRRTKATNSNACAAASRARRSAKSGSRSHRRAQRYPLKTPWRNGTTHVERDAVDAIARLGALVPPPRAHLTRFHGVFAPNAAL